MPDQDPDYHINPNYQKASTLRRVRSTAGSTPFTSSNNSTSSTASKRPPTAVPATPRMLRNTSGHQVMQSSSSNQRLPGHSATPSAQSSSTSPSPLGNKVQPSQYQQQQQQQSPNRHAQLPPLNTVAAQKSPSTPTRLLPPVSVDQQQQQQQQPKEASQRTSSTHNSKKIQQAQFHRRSIGEWDFIKTIGAGSMGKVKLARHRRTNEICAIKIIPRATRLYARNHANDSPPADSKELEKRQKEYEKEFARDKRTIREASLGKILYHPFICRLFEVITMSNHYYMLFEYVSGGQMLDYIVSHGSLKERHARKFVRGIASALDYLHRNNVVHRDLKIENIMISSTGDIKIIDFGLSNFYSNDALLKTYCGSLYFAAPELLSAHPYIGPEVDVWSFGVVLYVLVCGKVPFDDQDVSVLHEKIKKGKVEYPDFLSSEVVSLLSRMFVVNPNKRAGLAEVMSHPWLTRGYEGPPTSFVPHRIPLTLPLDPATLTEMANLEFGSNEEQIAIDLSEIISSKLYQDASENWFKNQRSDINSQNGQVDPTIGFHPLVSIYYLVEEMLKRKKAKQSVLDVPQAVKEQPKEITPDISSQQLPQKPKIDKETEQPPVLTFPEAAHTSPRDSSPPSFPERQQGGLSVQDPANDEYLLTQQQKQSKSSTATDEAKGLNSILRKFSQRRAHSQRRPPPGYDQSPSPPNIVNTLDVPLSNTGGFNNGDETTNANANVNAVKFNQKYMSPQQDALVRRVGSLKLTRNPAFDTPEKPTPSHNNSLAVPSSKSNKSHNRTVSAYASPADALAIPGDEAKVAANSDPSNSPNNPQKKFHPNARAKSVGHAARRQPSSYLQYDRSETAGLPPLPTEMNDDAFFDDVTLDDYSPTDKATLVDSNTSADHGASNRTGALAYSGALNETQILAEASRAPEGTMPSIEYPRSLFLKGFFSVQTTSTKPLPIIRANIISVLTKLGVKFTEVRGGFVCVHVPSIEQPTIVVDQAATSPTKAKRQEFVDEDQSLKSAKSSIGGSANIHPQDQNKIHALERAPTDEGNLSLGDESFDQQSTPSSKTSSGAHRRKFSIGGSILGSYRRKNGAGAPPIPPTPIAASKYESHQMTLSPSAGTSSHHGASSSHGDYDSTASLDSLNGEGGSDMLISSRIEQNKIRVPSASGGQSGQAFSSNPTDTNATITEKNSQQDYQQQQNVKARTPLKFEIHIVKVPLVGLSGVHFKKVLGNTWMYKALAGQILNELHL